jgi:hypothetical protein
MTLRQLISGGQTGAERGALHAALALGWSHRSQVPVRGDRRRLSRAHAHSCAAGEREQASPDQACQITTRCHEHLHHLAGDWQLNASNDALQPIDVACCKQGHDHGRWPGYDGPHRARSPR